MFKSYPYYQQLDRVDCGPTCFKMIAKFHGKYFDLQYLRDKMHLSRNGVSLETIADVAESVGMHTFAGKLSYETLLNDAPLPCVAYWSQRHFVVVYEVRKDSVLVADPSVGMVKYSKQKFIEHWETKEDDVKGGYVLLLEPTPKFQSQQDIQSTGDKKGIIFLSRYLGRYRAYLIQLFLGLALVGLIQVLFPLSTQAIVDYGIKTQNFDFIILVLIAQLVLILSKNLADVFRSWLLLHMASRINLSIVSDFLTTLMRLPVSFFEQRLAGDVMQRVEDNHRIEHLLSNEVLNIAFSFLSFFVFAFLLFYYNALIALVFVTGTILYVVWASAFQKKSAVLDRLRFEEMASNSSNLLQLIAGIQEIKLNNSEKRRRWEWEHVRARLYRIAIESLKVTQYQASGAQLIHDLKNLTITFLAATAVVNGDMTLGMMLSIQYIVGQMNSPLTNIVYLIRYYQEARISFERLLEVDNVKPEDNNEGDRISDLSKISNDIEFRDVSFRYGGNDSNWVLRNVNFKIPQGKTTAIVGPSGSGKTSLLKLLVKFYDPTSGNIYVGGKDLRSIDQKPWRDSVGAVMQDGYIFSDTVERNITESSSNDPIDQEKLDLAIDVANLGDVIENLQLGIKTRIGMNRMSLSGGEKQRVLIARAVYKSPHYLLLDEATSSLDAQNERGIIEKLSDFAYKRTVLVIAHRLSTVRHADQIIVLDKGVISECGSHDELIQKRGAYYSLIKNQLELGL